MKPKADDEGIEAVRDVRMKISADHAHDARQLVEHYLAEQEAFQARMLGRLATTHAHLVSDATRRR